MARFRVGLSRNSACTQHGKNPWRCYSDARPVTPTSFARRLHYAGSIAVGQSVASSAKRHQILFHVRSGVAPEPNVVNLEVAHAPAHLASPVVSCEYLAVQSRVAFRVQPRPRALRRNLLHATLPFTAERKAFFLCCLKSPSGPSSRCYGPKPFYWPRGHRAK